MQSKVSPLLRDTYIAVIKNSVGAKTWRNFYADVNGSRQDVMRDGELSCAFFVSAILTIFGLIDRPHGTVRGTLYAMRRSGWRTIQKPQSGSVLVWEAKIDPRGESHKHIGFYLGEEEAISNSSSKRVPVAHHWTFGSQGGRPSRKIEAIFWHQKLR